MCNRYRQTLGWDDISEDFSQLKIPLRYPELALKLEPRPDVRPTNVAPMLAHHHGRPALVLIRGARTETADGRVESFTIMRTSAGDDMQVIHDRRPVILACI